MTAVRLSQAVLLAFAVFGAQPAMAHDVTWKTGETRLKAYGHCAKGACQLRASFGALRPHVHAASADRRRLASRAI